MVRGGVATRRGHRVVLGAIAVATVTSLLPAPGRLAPAADRRVWTALSSGTGELPVPPGGPEQTALLVGDVDGDADGDLVIGSRFGANSVVLYRNTGTGWQVEVVEPTAMPIDAGGDLHDVDADGDLDVVLADDHTGSSVWWWRNPGPAATGAWERFALKASGPARHHDIAFGDPDGDGRDELVMWNLGRNGARVDELVVAEIPTDPTGGEWPRQVVFDAPDASEGLAVADVTGDGVDDIVSTGRITSWTGTAWETTGFDPFHAGQVAVGDLIAGGRPEIVVASGDTVGALELFTWRSGAWDRVDLLAGTGLESPWRMGHSVDVGDVDRDGNLDVFSAEMALGAAPTTRAVVLLGNGTGGFVSQSVSDGDDHHESVLFDVDGDGDPDVVAKPFNAGAPGIRIYRNDTASTALGNWTRHHIGTRAHRSTFVMHGDVDGDGDPDLVTGPAWWENPGSIGGTWTEHPIGTGLGDAAVLTDLDGDGDLDVFGTRGRAAGGSDSSRFAWAANDGTGSFVVRTNLNSGTRSFLQGVATGRLTSGGPLEIWLSWNDRDLGIDRFVVPTDPTGGTWALESMSPVSQGEDIELTDVDRDGDLDLLEGHLWLRNDGATWVRSDLHTPNECCVAGDPSPGAGVPDRVVAADVDADGRVDVVVTHEYSVTNHIVWYRQPADPGQEWAAHTITSGGPLPYHSLDVADLDGDGDLDVVAGEHDAASTGNGTTAVFENRGGGTSWRLHEVHAGEDHHDGTQLADLDRDGDLDIYSIGWIHDRLVVHENTTGSGSPGATGWWEDTHRYRIDITVAAPPGPVTDGVASIPVNLTAALASVGGAGAVDEDSIVVVEVSATGARRDRVVAHQWQPSAAFDPLVFAAGHLRLGLEGTTTQARHYQAYFDTVSAGLTPRSPASLPGDPLGAVVTGSAARNGRRGTAGAWDGTVPATEGAFVEHGGTVTIEAEHYDELDADASHAWTATNARPGYGGTGAMVVGPDRGRLVTGGLLVNGPELTYRVRFSTTGTYLLWVRGLGPDKAGNSVHAGIDGFAPTAAKIESLPVFAFGWSNRSPAGTPATIAVTTPGIHTIHLWMREDGAVVDRIHLTKASTTPTGIGPSESAREGETANRPPQAVIRVNTASGPAPLTVRFSAADSMDSDGSLSAWHWDFGDGTTATGPEATHVYATARAYTATLIVTDDDGATSTTTTSVTATAAAPTPAYLESGGSVTMEAERFTSSTTTASHRWVSTTARPGFSGTAAMVTTPDSGKVVDGSIPTASPGLAFRVRFSSPGTYAVWVRGLAPNVNADSLHAGLNNSVPATADKLNGFGTSWGWRRRTADGVDATVTIPAAGIYTVHVWMREDGLLVDKVHLTRTSAAPSGLGPPESPRGT